MEARALHPEFQALLQGQVDKNLPIPIKDDATKTHPFLPGRGQGARADRDLPVPMNHWVSSQCQGPSTSPTPSRACKSGFCLPRCSVLVKSLSEQL